MVNQVEDGKQLTLDFQKLRKVAATDQDVIPVVLQNAENGDVLFVGYANDEAIQETLKSKTAVLWSTSRNELWRKGATSGDVLELIDIRVNCEQNSMLYRVIPRKGGVCHTKDAEGAARTTCYYRLAEASGDLTFV